MVKTILYQTHQSMRHRISLCLVFLFALVFSIQAQTPVSFCVSSATDNGNGVTLAVTTENFEDILSAQFTVQWNSSELELISLGNFNLSLGIDEQNFTPPSISNPIGQMGFSWFDSNLIGQTVPDGSILFSLTFATSSNSSQVSVNGSLVPIEVIDSNGDLVPLELKSGTITSVGGTIKGNVFYDIDEDCFAGFGEQALENWIVKMESSQNTFYATTDALGDYIAYIPLGNYEVSIQNLNTNWESTCVPVSNQNLNTSGETLSVEFPIKAKMDCPAMEVNLSTIGLEKCTSNNVFTVSYCNLGTMEALGASVEVTFDEYISIVSSPIAFGTLGGNSFSFDIGNVGIGECGNFDIIVDVSCSAPDGITHCSEAHIFPDTICDTPNPLWTGASLEISGECNMTNDSVIFTVRNVGQQDMIQSSVYIVIEDAVLLYNSEPLDPIATGGNRMFTFPADGKTYRMETPQVDFHPGLSMPSATVEGCGASMSNPTSIGFVNQYPQDEANSFVSIACHNNIFPSDLNSKEAFPEGYGNSNYIEPNTDIEYLIRFQNTGTDTVLSVTIRDTLSEFLNPATVRNVVSSHPHNYEVTGDGVVVFTFPNIDLPNSNANEIESRGFVQFKVSQQPDVPLETVIENTSATHFDLMSPTITNTVFHTVGTQFITVNNKKVFIPNLAVQAYPNPFHEAVQFKIEGINFETIELKLFDLRGSLIQTTTSLTESFTMYRNNIPSGTYVYTISGDGNLVSSGKLIIK